MPGHVNIFRDSNIHSSFRYHFRNDESDAWSICWGLGTGSG